MIVTAGQFFANYLFMLMQDCPNLNYWSCAVVEHGPQKSSLFCSWSHAERLSLVFEAPEVVARRAPSRLHLPTELRVHRTKQTLIFAFIAAQCTQTIKIHTIQLSRAQENKRTWSLSKYACLWVFWQHPCMTAVLVWFDCRNSSCCSGRGQMFLWLFTFTFQLFSFLKLLWKHSSQFITASSSTGLSGSAWRVCRPLQTQRCVHLLYGFVMYFRPLVYKSKMCLGGVFKMTSFFKILQRDIVWLLVFGKLNEQWKKKKTPIHLRVISFGLDLLFSPKVLWIIPVWRM